MQEDKKAAKKAIAAGNARGPRLRARVEAALGAASCSHLRRHGHVRINLGMTTNSLQLLLGAVRRANDVELFEQTLASGGAENAFNCVHHDSTHSGWQLAAASRGPRQRPLRLKLFKKDKELLVPPMCVEVPERPALEELQKQICHVLQVEAREIGGSPLAMSTFPGGTVQLVHEDGHQSNLGLMLALEDGSPSTRFVDAAGLGTETRRPSQPQLRERAATFASASDLPASTPLQCGEATLFDTSWPHAGPPVNVDAPMRNTIFIALSGGSHARRKRTYDAPIYTEAAQKRCDEQNRKLARKE
jgi:hypothetical protein